MNKEDSLQISVANYLRLQYPKALFAHIANERQTSPQRGAKLKKMGVKAGMPDVMIFEQKPISTDEGTCFLSPGLCLELKIKPNKPSKQQLQVLNDLEVRGWRVAVIYDFDSAKSIIDEYLR